MPFRHLSVLMMIRPATSADAVMALSQASGLFGPDGPGSLREMLEAGLDGTLRLDHVQLVDEDDGLASLAYVAPEPFTSRVWNLHLIAVDPSRQGQGRGTTILRHVERMLAERGERLLLIETSGVDGFEATRAFYRTNGYDEEARIRDDYEAGDDVVIFRKALQA